MALLATNTVILNEPVAPSASVPILQVEVPAEPTLGLVQVAPDWETNVVLGGNVAETVTLLTEAPVLLI